MAHTLLDQTKDNLALVVVEFSTRLNTIKKIDEMDIITRQATVSKQV
jgi:hypothetical protein